MELLRKYVSYNLWANKRILDEFLPPVSEADLDKEFPGSFSSLRKTLYHIWDAELIWYDRVTGGAITVLPITHEPMVKAVFVPRMLNQSNQWIEFLNSRPDSFFEEEIAYTNSEGKKFRTRVGDIIHHLMNHGSYHRGQVINLLRALGYTNVGSTDFITYVRLPR